MACIHTSLGLRSNELHAEGIAAFAAMLERHAGLCGFSIWNNPGVAGVKLSPEACQVR